MRRQSTLRILLTLFTLTTLTMVSVFAQEDEAGTVNLRVGHFAPDAPNVDIYVDGELTIENLDYTDVTPFTELPAGTYEIAATESGMSVDDAVIGPVDVTLEADTNVTIAAVGEVANESLTVTVFTEDFSEAADGNGTITVLHAIEGEGAVDILGSGIELIEALRFPNADAGTDGAFTREVPAGTYTLNVSVASNDVVVRSLSGVVIEEGEFYLVVALGPQANSGEILVVTPEGNLDDEDEEMVEDTDDAETADDTSASDEDMILEGTAELRVGHFSPDAPNVDVYIDGELAVGNLDYTQVTPFLELDAGIYEVIVTIADTSVEDVVLGPLDVTVQGDTNTTVAVVGEVGNATLTTTVFTEDFSEQEEGNATLTVLHAIEGESAVDIFGSGIELVEALRFPGANTDGAFTRQIPAGTYTINVNVSETTSVIRTLSGVEVEAGEFYLIVALGPQSNTGDLLIVTPEGNLDDETEEAESGD